MQLQSATELETFLEQCDQDLVIKPVSAASGTGIVVLKHEAAGYTLGGEIVDVPGLWKVLTPRLKRGYLVEQRLVNTAEIACFNPDCLNTYRVVTIRTDDGVIHTPAVSLKIGLAGSMADNNGSGNIQLNLRDDGTVYGAYNFSTRERVSAQPET